jgi:hypothetical protein
MVLLSHLKFSIVILISLLLISCSASTDTRYSKSVEKEDIPPIKHKSVVEDDFDIKPYQTEIEFRKNKITPDKKQLDLWFEYETKDSSELTAKTIIDTIPGYRVEVISTDNLDEANSIRSEIFFKTNEKAIYIIFEPPFYILRVGDYKNFNDAKAISFKLNQLGYSGTKVVNDLINIFK